MTETGVLKNLIYQAKLHLIHISHLKEVDEKVDKSDSENEGCGSTKDGLTTQMMVPCYSGQWTRMHEAVDLFQGSGLEKRQAL